MIASLLATIDAVAATTPPTWAAAASVAAGGGVPALFVGSWIGRRIGGPTLARVFAVAIVIVAALIIFKTFLRF